jgi:DNA repair exonuclease SbcCD ATPase subunit
VTQNLLKRVEISDFRSFGDFSLDLPRRPGLTILTGSNGLGKSNFFDALEWAVTGEVRRFARHRSRRVTEADYLTREGAPLGSHRVSLFFGDGKEIRRGDGDDTPPASILATLVEPGWTGEVEDLSVYLGLTHFLGQSSEQRFTSRQGSEQWEALKRPAGVERVEALRNRIGGRGARLAFNRRIEAGQNVLRRDEEALARWDSMLQQLRRLERTASAAGVLSPDRIIEEARALAARVELLRLAPSIEPIGDAATMLEALRESLDVVARRIAEASARLDEATALSERFTEIGTQIARIDTDRPEASEEVRAAMERTEQALRNVHQQNAAMGRRSEDLQRLKGHVEMLRSSQADKTTLAAATAAAAAAESELAAVEAELTRVREQRKDAETVHATAQAFHAQASRLAIARQQAIAMAERAQALETAEARVAAAAANTAAALLGEDDLVRSEEDLKRRRETLKEAVRQGENALVEARRKASEITRALSILAAHISVNDPNCPVCRTAFPPGELKRLAGSAASTQDAELARLEAELASINSDLAAVERELRRVEEARGAVLAATAAEARARVTAERIRREAASAYPIAVPGAPP